MAKVNTDKFIALLVELYCRRQGINRKVVQTYIDDVLEQMGFKVEDGEIKEIHRKPKHEARLQKTSESLDTIYLYPDDRYPRGLSICWSEIPCCSGSIEFTRTDYFVEKAVGFIFRERWKYDDSKEGNEAFAKAFREYMSNTSDKT